MAASGLTQPRTSAGGGGAPIASTWVGGATDGGGGGLHACDSGSATSAEVVSAERKQRAESYMMREVAVGWLGNRI